MFRRDLDRNIEWAYIIIQEKQVPRRCQLENQHTLTMAENNPRDARTNPLNPT